MDICTIITARGGSKGIPRKNIKLLNNKPVIAYSIEESLNCNLINKTYVTTEDEEISKISRKYGAEIIKRPIDLAADDSTSVDVILHSLEYLESKNNLPDFFILLQPTSPLRIKEDIENSIKLFTDNDCDAVISVCEIDHASMLSFSIENNYLTPNCDESFLGTPRQKLPKFYYPNGAIYVTTPDSIRKYKTFHPKKTVPYLMPKERSVDLDTLFDFKFAEFLLKNRVG